MFNYVNFHNVIVASQVQFLFAVMHILNNSWCDWECTGVLQHLCFKTKRKSCSYEKEGTNVLVLWVFFWFKPV